MREEFFILGPSNAGGTRAGNQERVTEKGVDGGVNSELLKYLSGETNAVRSEFIVSRERAPESDLVYITPAENEAPLYTFWHSRKKAKGKSKNKNKDHRPKNIGGKRPYIMMMLDRAEVYLRLSVTARAVVLTLIVCGCIDWHTGRLLYRQKPLTKDKMAQLCGLSTWQLRTALQELVSTGMVEYRNKSWYFSREYAKRGGSR